MFKDEGLKDFAFGLALLLTSAENLCVYMAYSAQCTVKERGKEDGAGEGILFSDEMSVSLLSYNFNVFS